MLGGTVRRLVGAEEGVMDAAADDGGMGGRRKVGVGEDNAMLGSTVRRLVGAKDGALDVAAIDGKLVEGFEEGIAEGHFLLVGNIVRR